MTKVAVITDSTATLPAHLLAQYNISVLPLTVVWGEETLRDGVDISPSDFYTRLASSRILPTTSQATVPEMKTAFASLLEQGFSVLGIFLSSAFSGTYASALLAQQELASAQGQIEVVDSRFTTMAMGWPVLAAARAAQAGENLAECLKVTHRTCENTGVLFVVETLEYLRRGGRIGGAQALLGTALNIKPLLQMQDGRIETVEKIRTKSKAVARLMELVAERVAGRSPLRLATVHANAEAEAQVMLETARARLNPVESFTCPLSPTIGLHAGPGTVALAYSTGT